MNSVKPSRRKLLATTTVVLTLVMAIAYSLTQPANATTTHDVTILDLAFNPQDITINPGDTIQWLNNDPLIYTLWFVYAENESTCPEVGDGGLSDPILPEESWSWTFNEEMTLKYYCFERLWITGTITVETVGMLGDFTGPGYPPPSPPDGTININDIRYFIDAYKSQYGIPPPPGVDPTKCDLTGPGYPPPSPPDGTININDIRYFIDLYKAQYM